MIILNLLFIFCTFRRFYYVAVGFTLDFQWKMCGANFQFLLVKILFFEILLLICMKFSGLRVSNINFMMHKLEQINWNRIRIHQSPATTLSCQQNRKEKQKIPARVVAVYCMCWCRWITVSILHFHIQISLPIQWHSYWKNDG